jgi:hypothetical protein
MVALEIFTLSSIYAAGNLLKYFAERMFLKDGQKVDDAAVEEVEQPVEKFVELSVERTEHQAPFYLHPGNSPISVPIGGGSTTELREILSVAIGKESNFYCWRFIDLEKYKVACAPSTRYWLNTPDDLKNFFETHKIPQNIIPLSLPMHVREIKAPPLTPVYRLPNVMGTNKKAVIEQFAWGRTFGRSAPRAAVGLAVFTGSYLWMTWDEYHTVQQRRKYGLA